jgi:alanine dehydrogenase
MRVGIPKEIKQDERRVALTPAGVLELSRAGHRVIVEAGAGAGSGFPDDLYVQAGARLGTAEDVWQQAELVVKVKEPIAGEYGYLRDDVALFSYLHLAAEPDLTRALLDSGTTALAYETLTDSDGRLPLLAPMSAIAGQLAIQAAAHHLQAPHGGSGVLLGPVGGVAPGKVVVIGGGVVGYNATVIALGLGARVTLFDRSIARLLQLETILHGRIELEAANADRVGEAVAEADVVVGAVLVAGAKAPRVVDRAMVQTMKPGSVICDVAIDQGGCVETSRPTTHSHPTYEMHGVVHYAVTNMPGAVPATSSRALANATLPYVLAFADRGIPRAGTEQALSSGLNVCAGVIEHPAVAESFAGIGPATGATA